MKKQFLLFLLMSSLCLLPACGVKSGNDTLHETSTEELNKQIIVGKTTKDDIRSWLGQANDISTQHDGTESWTYIATKISDNGLSLIPIIGFFSKHETKGKILNIIFNKNNTVKSFSTSNTQDKAGLAL